MQTALYLGTDPAHFLAEGHWDGHLIHYPVIQIVPRSEKDPEIRSAFDALSTYTHLVFTSKNGVEIFFALLLALGMGAADIKDKQVIAVGLVTATCLRKHGIESVRIAQLEQQEGIIALLKKEDLSNAHLFLPRSSLAREILTEYLQQQGASFTVCDLYDTVSQQLDPTPDLDLIDAVIFTSPSTVRAFVEIFHKLPTGKKILAIGPVTEKAILEAFDETQKKITGY